MFQSVATAPPDPILGLTEAFKKDPNPNKINLGVGVYKDPSGQTPVLRSVKEAERRLLDLEKTKGYKPIEGDAEYDAAVQGMIFGADHELTSGGRAVTVHTPGGTGGLRVVGDYLARLHEGTRVWLSDPTWANHAAIFKSAGVPTMTYRYFDHESMSLNFEAMLDDFRQIPAGDVVLLHGCCHNPTGQDPTASQWGQIAELLAERGIVPLIDFAYQGFAAGLEEDAVGLNTIAGKCDEFFVCSSFSKNFGLYNERTGALTVVAGSTDGAQAVLSQIKVRIRTNYSNPPAHGGEIVRLILGDPELKRMWIDELTEMRDRINGMRQLFVRTLASQGVPGDYGFIERQNGMFSFSGLSPDQVKMLREKHAIYIVGSGRINVAGMTESNMTRLCDAIRDVIS